MESKRKLSISSLVTDDSHLRHRIKVTDTIHNIAASGQNEQSINPADQGPTDQTAIIYQKNEQLIEQNMQEMQNQDQTQEHINLVIAAEALTKLNTEFNKDTPAIQHPLIEKVTNHPIISQAVKVYENSKNYSPIFNYGAGMFERAAKPMVQNISKNLNNHINKRQKLDSNKKIVLPSISKTLYQNKNFQEFQENFNQLNRSYTEFNLNMSIESKKRIQFCLHLLKLANVQITNKVNNLQSILIEKQKKKIDKLNEKQDKDKSEKQNFKIQTKKEIITTIKKIVNVFAKFTGNNISEPARNNIRESLLKLPINWSTSLNSVPNSPLLEPLGRSPSKSVSSVSSMDLNSNNIPSSSSSKTSSEINLSDIEATGNEMNLDSIEDEIDNEINNEADEANEEEEQELDTSNIINNDDKVLLLAKESLDMITNMMNIFDEQLNKAELWIKHKKDEEVKKKFLLHNDNPN